MNSSKKQPKSAEIQAIEQPNSQVKYKVKVGEGKVGIKGTLSAEHEAHWDTKSYSILAVLLALLFGFVSLVSFGIYELIPLPTGLKVALAIIVFCALIIVGCWQRYRVLMFTHWLDRKLTAKKTYHDK